MVNVGVGWRAGLGLYWVLGAQSRVYYFSETTSRVMSSVSYHHQWFECQNMWGPLNHWLYSYSFSRLTTVHFLLSELAEELSRTQVIFSVYEFINSACVPSTPVWEFYLSTYTLLTVLYSVLSGLCFFHEVATQLPVKAFISVDWNSYKTIHAIDKLFNDMVWCCPGHLGLWYCFKRGRSKTCLSPQLYKLAGIIPSLLTTL